MIWAIFFFFSNNFIEFHYRILNYVETFSKKPSKTENKLKEKKKGNYTQRGKHERNYLYWDLCSRPNSYKFLESSRRIFTRAKELALSECFLFSVLMNAKKGNIFSFQTFLENLMYLVLKITYVCRTSIFWQSFANVRKTCGCQELQNG